MNKTALVFSPMYYQHNPGRNHPESAKRLRAIISELKKGPFSTSRDWQFVEPGKASLKEIELVHGIEYIKLVEAVCKTGGGFLDLEDTVVSPESYEVALYAVGGALKAVDLVMKRKFQNAFALVRPPGHHASKYRACGFCLFNNVAVAARYLLTKFRVRRLLILDIDDHHGNGTQETFYDTDKVLYVSLHEDPQGFPGTGFIDETGEGEGLGHNVEIPLPFRADDQIYLKALKEIVIPIVNQYKPQFILVSAGFDGHYTDTIGSLSLSATCYAETFESIVKLASKNCEGKLVSVLEGGYSLSHVGKLTALATARMIDTNYLIEDKHPASSPQVRERSEKVIKEVKQVQRAFWNV